MDKATKGHYLFHMKSYSRLEETPLKFHRIYAAVVLPIDFFINLYSFFTILLSLKGGFDGWDIFYLALTVLYIVLIFLSFRGLLTFRRSGLLAVLALTAMQICDNAYTFYLSYRGGDQVFMFSALLAVLIMASIFLYYFLRRKLFKKGGMTRDEIMMALGGVKAPLPESVEVEEEEPVEEEDVGEYDCPRCGFHITDGKVFCPKCGAQTRKVR